jgi:Domain of unknown function (DUF4062)
MKVYLSSTYLDLKNHRKLLATALRKAKYEVVLMEESPARDASVEFACQGDVVGCDAYVGLFAWRYGHIPEDNNPAGKSVTEMEYLSAENKIPRLVFMLKDKARWPRNHKDDDLTRINELRTNLKKICAAYFSSRSELAMEVLAALRTVECTRIARPLDAIEVIKQGQEFGPSFLMNIKEKLNAFREAEFVELQLGPTPWWNTRLHLVAALAEEINPQVQIVFVDAERRFITMAPPAEIRQHLEQRWPKLQQAYSQFRKNTPTLEAVEENLWSYPMAVGAQFGDQEENVKEVLTTRQLARELGIKNHAEPVEVENSGQVFLQREIVRRMSPFVALVRNGRLEGLVDTTQLARKVADAALAQILNA